MSLIELDRRQLLIAGGGALLCGLLPDKLEAFESTKAVFASAVRLGDGSFAVQLLDELGQPIVTHKLEDRGHDVTISPDSNMVVAFARRPGRFMLAFSTKGNTGPKLIWARDDRHYFGHGVFSADGRLLYATENAFTDLDDVTHGVIGIYDVQAGFKRIGEHLSHGIGPHEMLLAPDGRTLVIANGGIMTHPDYRRIKLNLDDMKPNLAFVDSATGDLLDNMELAPQFHQTSIRHISIDGKNRVWFGCQHQGEKTEEVPLVGSYRRDGTLRLSTIPEELYFSVRNYVGSVMCNVEGSLVATSCPRGGKVLYWDAAKGGFLGETALRDGCGVAAWNGGFAMSNGLGQFGRVALPAESEFEITHRQERLSFDNHMIAF